LPGALVSLAVAISWQRTSGTAELQTMKASTLGKIIGWIMLGSLEQIATCANGEVQT
jgi:hypothetical protein